MWKRRTWIECAEELEELAQQFRNAYWGRSHGSSWPPTEEDRSNMERTSREAVEILRSLALAVRSEQDFRLVPSTKAIIGFQQSSAYSDELIQKIKQDCGFEGAEKNTKYKPLYLRQALNKIAHADPTNADFYVGPIDRRHDLILSGKNKGSSWIAIVSILRLIEAIKVLPDHGIIEP